MNLRNANRRFRNYMKLDIKNLKVDHISENLVLKKEPILSGELTGYPSIDKPQYKYYREVPLVEIDPHQTIYNMVFDTNKNNMDAIAIEYFMVRWTFRKLKKETDRLASAFSKMGLELGDVVLVGVSNSPEAVATFLALNKLGVVSKWFDVRAGEKDIEEYANDNHCKCLVAFDLLIPRVELILDQTELEKVVVIRATNSLPKVIQKLNERKEKQEGKYVEIPSDERYVMYNQFLKTGDRNSTIECVSFDKNRPSVMIQSSGTTGKPKTIVHSDFSCTSCVRSIAYADLPLEKGKALLVALPPWIAYGLGDAIMLPLVFGMRVVLSPIFTPNAVFQNLGKFHVVFAAPFNYRYIRDHYEELTSRQKKGLAMVECCVSGGDKITVEENQELEEVLGCPVVNGYGNNEGFGALSVNPMLNNRYGTVGIPKYGETIISYDEDSKQELPYGVEGEICSLTDTMFLEYENNLEETSEVKQVHNDGSTWLHTGDLGFIDEDGFVHLHGRKRRVITRLAFKISASTIEDKICEYPAVKECIAVEVKDDIEEHSPMAYIVLKDAFKGNENLIQDEIYNKCISELKGYEIPKYFRFVDELPYTQNGKYDFRLLEEQGNEYVENLKKENQKKLTI